MRELSFDCLGSSYQIQVEVCYLYTYILIKRKDYHTISKAGTICESHTI